MHPVLIIIPAAALILGPRFWVKRVLKEFDRKQEDFPVTAGELARVLLDSHQLEGVRVESTDIGDHYDHQSKAVRLHRDKLDSKTLTAVTTAAHEVAHAIQDASEYGPFVWRTRLVKVAQVMVEVGSAVLLTVPVTVLVTRRPVPPVVVGTAAISVLGAGVTTQLAALPSELDASFGRALPMLRERVLSAGQVRDARKILVACSLTYIASSLAAVLSLWPWLGRPRLTVLNCSHNSSDNVVLVDGTGDRKNPGARRRSHCHSARRGRRRRQQHSAGLVEDLVRQIGKPIIRGWFRFVYSR